MGPVESAFGGAGFLLEEREQGFGEAGEVPVGGGGLVREGVAALAVDGAEDLAGVVGLHEGAGAEVDGLAGDGHVVGVHDAVDEAEGHPVGDERGLAGDDRGEEGTDGRGGFGGVGVVAGDGVVGEDAEVFDVGLAVLRAEEVLEGSDADVAGGDAGEDGAGQGRFAEDGLAGEDGGEGAGGGDAEGGHGFRDEVFAEDGTEGGASVSAAREGRGTGAFELDVEAAAGGGELLAEEVGAAVAELGDEVAELAAGVGLGEGFGAGCDAVAGKDFDAGGGGERGGVDAEVYGEGGVELDERGGRDGGGVDAGVETRGQAGVGVVEAEWGWSWRGYRIADCGWGMVGGS